MATVAIRALELVGVVTFLPTPTPPKNSFRLRLHSPACYGLHGPGIESRGRRDLPHKCRPALGLTKSPVQVCRISFPGINQSGRGAHHPRPTNAEVKET
jgi:hypothetical protein